jgi:hypothetical protein
MKIFKYTLLTLVIILSSISFAQSKKHIFITANNIDSFNKYAGYRKFYY